MLGIAVKHNIAIVVLVEKTFVVVVVVVVVDAVVRIVA
jgi:hypothetical protein